MSAVHIREINDAHGDLVDLEYWHHECAPDDVPGWPSPESLDYPVYCAAGDGRVFEVGLTRYGLLEAPVSELAVHVSTAHELPTCSQCRLACPQCGGPMDVEDIDGRLSWTCPKDAYTLNDAIASVETARESRQ